MIYTRLLVAKLIALYLVQFVCTTAIAAEKRDSTEKKVNFVPVPYINYNRTGGFEFGGVPMASYRLSLNDTISPRSMTGFVGKYSTEGNWVTLIFQRMYWNEDNWRLTFAGGLASNGFQFFPDVPGGMPIDYNTSVAFGYIQVQRRVYRFLYGGLSYVMSKTDTEIEGQSNKETSFNAIGVKITADTRSNVYYPYSGFNDNISMSFTPEFLDNEFVGQRIEVDHNQYFAVIDKRDVIAYRVKGGFGLGDVAFEQQFIVGRNDIRGYTQGEYRGESIMTVQGEYRWNLYDKLGFVGFAGMATVWKSNIESNDGKLFPSIGGGFRYTVFPKTGMNVGMEAAVGLDDWGIYFRIGEAF
ncbi:BamA/TamA family outer membrane protein [Carboxylicivirga marina]|uniref:BamA/TamA family outer membrane protein n=1 Tax=Carboxylicivirga marina TaxID=2800988 RepID=A0ABS1HJM5_9BACT|nr:BamA/TamA family outer membrane protein [Carboxylicivirga marina]MBK3517786.1 BamA/TamA family outer membrane protein [Carboxylicivirga marina]